MTSTELAVIQPRAVERAHRVSAADMAWMAAVIDLKGRITRKANKDRRTPQLVLYVNAKDERIARRLSALTGTKPEPRDAPTAEAFMRRGCAEHCPQPHVHVEDYPWQMPQVTSWSITGIAAAVVLTALAPYMSTYADYTATVAEMTVNFAATGQGSGASRSSLARLEGLGWKIPPQVTHRMKGAPATRPRKEKKQEAPVMSDGSQMPAADPSDPEVRLLRAVFGLCPDCDRTEDHSHEEEDNEKEEGMPQEKRRILELTVTALAPARIDLDELVSRIAADKDGAVLSGKDNGANAVEITEIRRRDGQPLGLEAEFKEYWEGAHGEGDDGGYEAKAEARAAFMFVHQLWKRQAGNG